MGGAICLLIHLKNPNSFTGAILIAPMCKNLRQSQIEISNPSNPHCPRPTLPIVPNADLFVKSVKVNAKKLNSALNPNPYIDKPWLDTVLELLRITDLLYKKLPDVKLQFLVAHESIDVVTDPEVSVELYEKAASKDKTIQMKNKPEVPSESVGSS